MSTWISLFVGVTAILAFLGTGTVFVLSGRQKVRIETLEHQNADLRNDVTDRDRRITWLEGENEAKTGLIDGLGHQVAALEKLKLGEAYFEAMREQIEAHSTKVLANDERILQEASVIRGQNRDILALLADHRRQS